MQVVVQCRRVSCRSSEGHSAQRTELHTSLGSTVPTIPFCSLLKSLKSPFLGHFLQFQSGDCPYVHENLQRTWFSLFLNTIQEPKRKLKGMKESLSPLQCRRLHLSRLPRPHCEISHTLPCDSSISFSDQLIS